MSATKYPEIEVRLTGTDGNAFAVIGKVRRELKRGGVSTEEVSAFTEAATAGDYNHVLMTCMKWVEVN